MNDKLDYITRVLEKTKEKRTENYVIGRIWHTLNDLDIKLVPQQYVKRHGSKYALTDIYFPQLKLHVEINEPAHYYSIDQIEADALRRNEIESKTSHVVMTIDCTGNLDSIHAQVDNVVSYIKNEVANLRATNVFEPWNPAYENSPKYYKQKGYLDTLENVHLNTIEDICKLFNARFVKRGFLRPGAADHPTDDNMILWWPARKRQGWENTLLDDSVIERHVDSARMGNHVNWSLNAKRTHRIVFYKHKDELGYSFYRFKGVYELDKVSTSTDNGVVWKKISDRYTIPN